MSDTVGVNEETAGLKGDEKPSYDEVNEWLRYDPTTGNFFWRKIPRGRGRGVPCDKPAGGPHPSGYVFVQFGIRKFGAHRLAWLLETRQWQPEGMQIDHINGDPSDNRIENLRLATPSENRRNRRSQGNTIKGVRLHSCGKWEARISADGVAKYLGLHATADEARAAYNQAAVKYFGDFACLT